MKIGLVMVLFLACSSLVYAQSADTVSPDRPSFSNGAHIVPVGGVQIEAGMGRSRFGDTIGYDLGELLLRVGLTSRIEVRAGVPSYLVSRNSGVRSSGADDVRLEGKFLLKSGERGAVALLTTAILPSGTRSVAEHKFQPGATLISDVNVTKKIVVTTNAGYFRASGAGTRYHSTFGVSTVNFTISNSVQAYSEFYALNHQHGWLRRYAATGITWNVERKTAIDLGAGIGLANHAHGPDRYVSVGISHLF
jgi:hypothetical protein